MGTTALSATAPQVASQSVALRWLMRSSTTSAIVVGLLGAAYWGHTTGWKFTSRKPESGVATRAEILPPTVRIIPATSGTAELPVPGHNVQIEFASAHQVDAAGIDITLAWSTALTEQVSAAGEVTFDPTRVARIAARVGGVTRRVFKAVGDPVRAGEVLAYVDAGEVGKAKAEFQQSLVQARLWERTRDDLVGAKAAASPATVREAEAAVKEADVRLLAAAQSLTNLGLPIRPADFRALTPAETARRVRALGLEGTPSNLDATEMTANLLPIRAPFAGVVLKADVVTGEVVEAGKSLFVVVDPSRVWIILHLGSDEARRANVGQKAFFRPDGSSREHPAAVSWVGTAADEATRTVPIRAEAENAMGVLRASTLGRGRVVFREEPKALVVPHEAVRTFQGRTLVFVRDPDFAKPGGPKVFHTRVVTTGGKDERQTEILAGVAAGELVVSKGSGVLLNELTRAVVNR